MWKKIIICGYFGVSSISDEAILTVLLDQLHHRFGKLDLVVVCIDPHSVEADYGISAIGYDNVYRIAEAVRSADLVINVVSDNFFVDYESVIIFYVFIPVLTSLYRVPLILFAHNMELLFNAESCRVLSYGMQQATVIMGDERLKSLLERLYKGNTVLRPICVTADPSLLLQPAFRKRIDKIWQNEGLDYLSPPLIGVVLRPTSTWPDVHALNMLAQTFDTIIKEINGSIIFIPFQKQGVNDAKVMESIRQKMFYRAQTTLLQHANRPEEILGLIGRLDLLLAMRLHGLIFATISGIPCLGFGFDPGLRHWFDRILLGSYYFDLRSGLEVSKFVALVKELLGSKSQIAKHIHQLLPSLRTNAFLNFDILELFYYLLTAPSTSQSEMPRACEAYLKKRKEIVDTQNLTQLVGHLPQQLIEPLLLKELIKKLVESAVQEKQELTAQLQQARLELTRWKSRCEMVLRSRSYRILEPLRRFCLRSQDLRMQLEIYKKNVYKVVRKFLQAVFGPFVPVPIKRLIKSWYQRSLLVLDPNPHQSFRIYTTKADVYPDFPERLLISGQDKLITRKPVSLVATVKNEGDSIWEWLESIRFQTRQPDEIIIVDGGSTDSTVKKIQLYEKLFKLNIKLILAPGSNVAKGRNLAISHAAHEVIAVTDAGCILDREWLNLITLPFDLHPETEISAGYYLARSEDPFGKVVGQLLVPSLDKLDPRRFLPSSRSIAFNRSFWEKVGGYPEFLTLSGEDTLFSIKAKKAASQWAFVPDAVVLWSPPNSYRELCVKLFRWGKGDGEAGLFPLRYFKVSLAYVTLFTLLTAAMACMSTNTLGSVFCGLLFFIGWIKLLGKSGANVWNQESLRNWFRAIVGLHIIHISEVVGYIAGVIKRKRGVSAYQKSDFDSSACKPWQQR